MRSPQRPWSPRRSHGSNPASRSVLAIPGRDRNRHGEPFSARYSTCPRPRGLRNFQGLKSLRLRNWAAFPVPPATIDAVVLTRAHVDHSGYLPRLLRDGFRGPIYATQGTRALCRIVLPDSGHLQEEDASYANRKGFSKHTPAHARYDFCCTRRGWAALRERIHTDLGWTAVVSGDLERVRLA
jgi:hypothetical protein